MSPRRQQITNGLQWVRGELDQSLARARGLIEQYIENPKDMLPLQQAFVELHQMRGTAAMIQCFGVSAFGEEMRQAVRELMHDKVKQTDEAYTALLGAIVQIGDYIDALASGMDDCVLVLHPAINELRLARGKSILTEADLFATQMNSLGLQLAVPAGDDNRQEGFAQAHARKMMPVFMSSLLLWLKNQPDYRPALGRIGKIAEQIAAVALVPPVYQLWRTVAAIIEGLLTQTLEDSLELKRLFGNVGKQLKLLADSGEHAAGAKQGDLAFQLLFYAGRSDGQGPRVSAIRRAFELEAYLPPAGQVDALRGKIHGPTTQLLSKVAEEIRFDLGQIKDNIDLAVRSRSSGGGPDLRETRSLMKRVSDTLSTLGLQVLQRVVANQVLVMESADPSTPPSVAAWMDMATAILRVEHSLDSALFRQLRQSPLDQAAGKPELEEHVPHSMDLSEGRQALLRESLISLSRLKDSVDAYVRTGESTGLVEAAKTLNEVASGLLILEAHEASELVARMERHVKSPNVSLLRDSRERADRFADAISCIDYFLEGLRDGTPQGEGMLITLGRLLEYLDSTSSAAPERLALSAEPAPVVETAVVAAPALADEVDPEIRAIFVEEAGEVREQLETAVPSWAHNLQNRDALTTIRRAFHTLKGSGRMVGAASIGDFGFALENLLNRCLESAVAINQDVLETVQQALAMLPGLIDEFQNGGAASNEKLKSLVARANRLSTGETGGGAEPDMLAIFHEDAREKLALVTTWLAEQDRSEAHIAIPNDVVRSFHTLRGAAAIVGLTALAELAGALETYMDSTRGAGLGLTPAAMTLLDGASAELRRWAEPAATVPANAAKPWLERIDQLQSQVPESALQATADRQLAEVFSGEAFDLVARVEKAAAEWARAPENRQMPREMLTAFQTLMGAALMSSAPAIANVARALHNRMQEAVASSVMPDATFFARLNQVLEGVYQQLDNYQLGHFTEDGTELAGQVYQMQWTTEQSESLQDLGDIIEMPPVAESAVEFVPPPSVPETQAPAPEYAAEADAELLSIFLAEAQELLQNLDGYSAAWEQNPQAWQAANEVKRVLHTLKGSARMAGLPAIGEVAQRLEKLVVQTTRGEVALDASFFSRLHQSSDRLHGVVDDMQRGTMPDLATLLAEFETAPAPAPKPRVVEMPPAEPVAVAAPLLPEALKDDSQPPVEMPAVAEAEREQATQPADEGFADFSDIDADLAEVFTAEAGELLEELEKSLGQLESNPRDTDALRDIQRVLHTLKGGARMASLEIMGNAAHDMETRVHGIEIAPGAANADTFATLRRELESLQHMHDRLQRGDAARHAPMPAPVAPVAPPAPAPVSLDEPAADQPQPDVLVEAAPELTAEPPAASIASMPAGYGSEWDPLLFWRPEEDATAAAQRRETARVPVETLDAMLNQAGEISIYRSRLEEHNSAIQAQLTEMTQAITRLREQLRMMDIETEAQIAARGMTASGDAAHRYEGDFDPLEMDRYTRMQELSRAVSESVGDLAGLHGSMDELTSESETLLLQQGRINTEVQTGLMGTLMVPFSRQVARLQRVVKQTAAETGKQAEALFSGIESELDRNVLERMTASLEHLLRNAVVHGLEEPSQRRAAGKNEMGQVNIKLWREGTQLLIELRDDGKGLDFEAIRATAIKRGLMPADAQVSDEDVAQFIFAPGFSTAKQLTQAAGRGIGMDVVVSEVKQLGGTLELGSEPGKGVRFLIRLPLTLAISQALLVGAGEEQFAIPLSSIEGIARIPREQLENYYREDGPMFSYGGHEYRVRHLADFIGAERDTTGDQKTLNAILVRLGEGLGAHERRVAVVVDALFGNREVVSKAVGPQISSVSGVSGATILADGHVVLILDVPALAQDRSRRALVTLAAGVPEPAAAIHAAEQRDLIMVVDDSVTIRRVTERLLLKHGFRVVTAKDGLDAMAQLQTVQPATVLLDIEMPRADGFEVAAFIRNSERIKKTPIIMITSRSGDKHRERARQIGVNRYMIKPFQEDQLMSEIREVMAPPA